ncbi:hypothetical protein BKA63DRAFT_514067 [Paraphoma chrysanthemicola]|nr:hypothetical protein BKA63DRAFT_514067 [Paraphoma chrysanthemicola]
MQYKQDLSNYYKDIKEYRRLKDKLGQVEAHITKTIKQDLIYHIKDELTVHNQLRRFKSSTLQRQLIKNTASRRRMKRLKLYTLADQITKIDVANSLKRTIEQSKICQKYMASEHTRIST